MAFATWPWNLWLDEFFKGGNQELLVAGLKKAVVTHRYLGRKSDMDILKLYGVEYRDEIVNGLAVKVLSDKRLKESSDNALGDYEISQRIYTILTNHLKDLLREQRNEKSWFESSHPQSAELYEMGNEPRTEDFSQGPNCSHPPDDSIIADVLRCLSAKLSPRQQTILRDYKDFGGKLSVEDLMGKFRVEQSTIYEEIKKIKMELANILRG